MSVERPLNNLRPINSKFPRLALSAASAASLVAGFCHAIGEAKWIPFVKALPDSQMGKSAGGMSLFAVSFAAMAGAAIFKRHNSSEHAT